MDPETLAALNALTEQLSIAVSSAIAVNAQLQIILSSTQAIFNFLLGALTGCAFVAAVTREFI